MNKRQLLRHKKKVSKECWNMDNAFYKWAEEHLKTYLKDAGKIVDLEFQSFTVDEVKLNQKDAIIHMINLLGEIHKIIELETPYDLMEPKKIEKKFNETLEEFGKWWFKVLPAMWW